MSTNDTRPLEAEATDDSSTEPNWTGPFVEPSAQGGAMYWRCNDCGAEVIDGHRDDCSHRPGCPAR